MSVADGLKVAEDLLPDCRQMWVRPDGGQPWIMDLAMNPHDGDTWISVRDEQVRMRESKKRLDEIAHGVLDLNQGLTTERELFLG